MTAVARKTLTVRLSQTRQDFDEVRRFLRRNASYNVKEQLADAYDAPDRFTAERAIAKLIQAIPPELGRAFSEMTTAYGNWKTPILNYFEERATNGYTEAQNSLIREMDQMGRGYSFEVMRARMLYDRTARKKSTATRSRLKRLIAPDDACAFMGFDFADPFANDDDEIVEYGPSIETLLEMLRHERDPVEHFTET